MEARAGNRARFSEGGSLTPAVRVAGLTALALSLAVSAVLAQQPQSTPKPESPDPPSSQEPSLPAFASTVTVIGTTPLPGIDQPVANVPAPIQTATDRDLERSGALEVSDFLSKRLTSVHVNDMQGNPFQADINYRGYTASPLLGTPQGLSVYLDGVRLNQPFGDVVSWDLIPRGAISSMAMMPGSNPLFGLNTLGGALAIQTKSGLSHPGTAVQAVYGSNVRRAVEFEHGGSRRNGLNWYLAGNLFAEDGWRENSPSRVGQLFGKIGSQRPKTDVEVTFAYASNSLTGNGLQEQRFIARDYASVYTKPDITDNRSSLVNLSMRRRHRDGLVISGNAYYRHLHTNTLNGDLNEDSLDQSLYQPSAAEQAALAAAGYGGFPVSGATAANAPFPFWRCLGNVLLRDEPAEKCNGLINRTQSSQDNAGLSGQVSWISQRRAGLNQFTAGAAYDHRGTNFLQSTELGYLNPDRSISGTGAFADGVTGGTVDGAPYDNRIDLDGRSDTVSAFATDTLTLAGRWHITVSGRFDQTRVRNRDGIIPGGAAGSLDGNHTFNRLNPAVGLTVDFARGLNAYGAYTEASRAPTSIELGCADPEQPCKLPNALGADPPLDRVVARTWEAGLRGGRRVAWSAGFFRANNDDDILFVQAEQTGFGFFKNFGSTRRQGVELNVTGRFGRLTSGAGYTHLDATYQSREIVNGASNSTNDAAAAGTRGVDGAIEIEPGNRIPLIPRHLFKVFADIQVRSSLSVDADLTGTSGSFARGNENNLHQGDGSYYLGPGFTGGYAVVDFGARYRVTAHIELLAHVDNVFDRRYYTGSQLGVTGFTGSAVFASRPLPAVNGVFPLQHATFYAPGGPRTFWVGTRIAL